MAALGSVGYSAFHLLYEGVQMLNIPAAQDITANPARAVTHLDIQTVVLAENRKVINLVTLDEDDNPISRRVYCLDTVAEQIVDVTSTSGVDGSGTLRPPLANECIVIMKPDGTDARNMVGLSELIPIDP